ncbi:MAG: hypothetical protein ACI9H8_001195 [Lysobacterales bacterium]|jgi:hypothetical protein
MKTLSRCFFLSFLCTQSLPAQDNIEELPIPPVSLANLVADADVVALVKVLDTDYQYTREFPSGGMGFLEVLIPYKVSLPLEDILEVYEEGLHKGECYFEDTAPGQDGRRYLIFLKLNTEFKGQYKGLKQGCKLDVLVRNNGQYALRFPLSGIKISDDFSPHAVEMAFQDEYAFLEDEEISPDERNELLAKGFLTSIEQRFEFTHGIDISTFRKLMGPDALTLDRTLK